MSTLLGVARHEVNRLQAICRKLSEIKLPAIKDETDQLQVLVSRMRRNLDQPVRQQRRQAATPAGLQRRATVN
jgi:hypothetical protein